ncbi:MAG TPA: DNA gyrase modulator, partial [Anaerolineae bacterium]|nr:DNA gyrase modulator [Anaerolineae bacterium]
MLGQIKTELNRLKGLGATYVDARWYPFEESSHLLMWNGNLKENTLARESGIGIRVLYNGAWGFSASSDMSNLPALFDKALDNAQAASERVTFPVHLADKETIHAQFASPC